MSFGRATKSGSCLTGRGRSTSGSSCSCSSRTKQDSVTARAFGCHRLRRTSTHKNHEALSSMESQWRNTSGSEYPLKNVQHIGVNCRCVSACCLWQSRCAKPWRLRFAHDAGLDLLERNCRGSATQSAVERTTATNSVNFRATGLPFTTRPCIQGQRMLCTATALQPCIHTYVLSNSTAQQTSLLLLC